MHNVNCDPFLKSSGNLRGPEKHIFKSNKKVSFSGSKIYVDMQAFFSLRIFVVFQHKFLIQHMIFDLI